MPTTANRGYPYPERTGVPPAVPQHLQAALDPIDADVHDARSRLTALESRRQPTRGSFTGVTGVTGAVRITHGLGTTPAAVIVTMARNNISVDRIIRGPEIITKTSTYVDIAIRRSDDPSYLVSNPCSFDWVAIP